MRRKDVAAGFLLLEKTSPELSTGVEDQYDPPMTSISISCTTKCVCFMAVLNKHYDDTFTLTVSSSFLHYSTKGSLCYIYTCLSLQQEDPGSRQCRQNNPKNGTFLLLRLPFRKNFVEIPRLARHKECNEFEESCNSFLRRLLDGKL